MIITKCAYDDVKDNSPVDQVGYVNLIECMTHGEVPSFVSNTEDGYNEIDDPASIIGKPRDAFEAIRMQNAIKSAGSTSTNTSSND